MSLVLTVAFASLALILYRGLQRALQRPRPPAVLQHWLAGDMLVCAITALFAFSVMFAVKAVAEFDVAPWRVADVAEAAAVAALAWLALARLSPNRGARAPAT